MRTQVLPLCGVDPGQPARHLGIELPAIAPAERQEEISKLEETIARRSAKVDRLTALAGDPEQAIDEQGWLPAERREVMLLA
jgi:hypothetical protein